MEPDPPAGDRFSFLALPVVALPAVSMSLGSLIQHCHLSPWQLEHPQCSHPLQSCRSVPAGGCAPKHLPSFPPRRDGPSTARRALGCFPQDPRPSPEPERRKNRFMAWWNPLVVMRTHRNDLHSPRVSLGLGLGPNFLFTPSFHLKVFVFHAPVFQN